MIPAGLLTIALTAGVPGRAVGYLLVIIMGVFALVGVSAYIDYQRTRDSTPIDVEVES